MSDSVRTTAEIIKKAIEGKNFTYRKLAELISSDHAYLHNIANGKKYPPNNVEFFEKMANTLNMNPSDFLEYRKLLVLKFLDKNAGHYGRLFDELISDGIRLDSQGEHTGLTVDDDSYQVKVDGNILDLTSKEFGLLSYMYNNEGRVLTREALLREVWGFDYFGGTRTVDVHIRRLRAKLEPKYQDCIETVRNIGYRFRRP